VAALEITCCAATVLVGISRSLHFAWLT
jgi:hypothetical protein